MHIKTTGIVIREQTISENDKLVTLLTRDNGVIRAFARGAKSPKSRKNAGTQQFCYCDFDIYSGNNIFSVEEARPKETFFALRNDIQILALAQYFCELIYELSPREEQSEDYLRLILNANYLLMNEKKERSLLKPVFELRILSMAGYMPSLIACNSCGAFETDTMFFDMAKGDIYCENCNNNKYFIPLSISVVTAMRHVAFAENEKLFSFNLKGQALKDFEEIVERYLLHVTMRKYKTLDFYKMVE